ncbi:MAG: arsenite methyltransferase [Anaerolineales bacterium]|nr:arsenite methyltransferase [Anaerolineales bacterium]
MERPKPDEIHSAVREFYARKAQAFEKECCGSGASCSCSMPNNYPAEELQTLPEDLADVTLGCGNPISGIEIRPGETVVDLGSGGGLDCLLAAQKVGAGGRVIGVDMTPEMIGKARANAARIGAANVEFRQGQIEAIPLADGEADVVVSNCVINLSPDKPAVFREMFRVLRSGGRVAVSDIVTRGPMSPSVAKSLESWAGCIAGALDVEEYRSGLLEAGFADVSVTTAGEGSCCGSSQPADGLPFSALIAARKPTP